MLDTLKICKEKNHEDASFKLYELINSRISSNSNYNIGLSGGSTPKEFYKILAENNSSFGFVANEVNILSKWRITSTFELLETVEDIFLLVTGNNKKSILKELGRNDALPVNQLINRREKTILITDQKI